MSERRAARGRRPYAMAAGASGDAIRTPVGDPRWRDPVWLVEHFPALIDAGVLDRLAMGARVDNTIRARWAMAHGYADADRLGSVDWHRFGPVVRIWRDGVDTEP